MTVAAYLRVSSRSQDAASQRDAITRCARARGDRIERWFSEKRSASTMDRPVLGELRELARRGDVRVLYVFRLDRLGRSGIRDTLGLLHELRGVGCRVVNVADGFDLEGPLAEVITAVMAWAAQMERLALGERIAAARVRVEAAGGSWGRPARAGAELAERVIRMRRTKTIREISIALKIPRSTVADILSGKGPYTPARIASRKRDSKKGRAPAAG